MSAISASQAQIDAVRAPRPIEFVIPGAPVGKGRPRVTSIAGHARMYTPAKTANYESLVAMAARDAMAGRALFGQAVAVSMFIACAVPASWSQKKRRSALAGELLPTAKPDLDNCVKAVFDGLNGVLWRDDVLVATLRVAKRFAETPCVRVSVMPIGGDLVATQRQAVAA